MSNFAISLIRTWSAIIIGSLLTWLASTLHIVIDPSSQAGLVALVTAVLSGAYYLVVHVLEQRFPQIGVLLGKAALPYYAGQHAVNPVVDRTVQ